MQIPDIELLKIRILEIQKASIMHKVALADDVLMMAYQVIVDLEARLQALEGGRK